MPEEINEDDKSLENPETEEVKKTSEEEEKPEPPKEARESDEEPKKRFPTDQTAAEKRAAYWERKAKTLEKRQGDVEEGDLFDEDEKPLTRREFNERMEKQTRQTASERMLSEFLSENPDYKKYEGRIRKYINDPDYSNIPIGFIASGIVGENIDDEANTRADLKRKADEEADKTKSGGSSKRSTPGKTKSIWDMSSDEFADYQQQVLREARE